MSRIQLQPFQPGLGTPTGNVDPGGAVDAAVTYSTTVVRHAGGSSAKVSGGTPGADAVVPFHNGMFAFDSCTMGCATKVYYRWFVRLEAAPSVSGQLLEWMKGEIDLNTNRTLTFKKGAYGSRTSWGSATAALTLDTWHKIELTGNAWNDWLEIRLNGAVVGELKEPSVGPVGEMLNAYGYVPKFKFLTSAVYYVADGVFADNATFIDMQRSWAGGAGPYGSWYGARWQLDMATLSPSWSDAFGRTASNGWGTADAGGSYTCSGTASDYAVSGGVGTIQMSSSGGDRSAILFTTKKVQQAFKFSFRLSALPEPGTYVKIGIVGRAVDASNYLFGWVVIDSAGTVRLGNQLDMRRGGADSASYASYAGSVAYVAGDKWWITLQIDQTDHPDPVVRVWQDGDGPGSGYASVLDMSSITLTNEVFYGYDASWPAGGLGVRVKWDAQASTSFVLSVGDLTDTSTAQKGMNHVTGSGGTFTLAAGTDGPLTAFGASSYARFAGGYLKTGSAFMTIADNPGQAFPACWIRTTSTAEGVAVGFGTNATRQLLNMGIGGGTHQGQLMVDVGGGTKLYFGPVGYLNDGKWHRIQCWWTSSLVYGYIDGFSNYAGQSAGGAQATVASAHGTVIGASGDDPTQGQITADICEVMVGSWEGSADDQAIRRARDTNTGYTGDSYVGALKMVGNAYANKWVTSLSSITDGDSLSTMPMTGGWLTRFEGYSANSALFQRPSDIGVKSRDVVKALGGFWFVDPSGIQYFAYLRHSFRAPRPARRSHAPWGGTSRTASSYSYGGGNPPEKRLEFDSSWDWSTGWTNFWGVYGQSNDGSTWASWFKYCTICLPAPGQLDPSIPLVQEILYENHGLNASMVGATWAWIEWEDGPAESFDVTFRDRTGRDTFDIATLGDAPMTPPPSGVDWGISEAQYGMVA
ncbi:MAG: hypothetical protein ACOYB2_10535 [Limnohabitans sp.]